VVMPEDTEIPAPTRVTMARSRRAG